MPDKKINIFWFRRDLRLDDNRGLHFALKDGKPVLPLFIFDTEILNDLSDKKDARVEFIHRQLKDIHRQLRESRSSLLVKHGSPAEVWASLIEEYDIAGVYTNADYEPYARQRDEMVGQLLAKRGVTFNTFKDQVIFEKGEVVKGDGTPYTVFTPYSKQWLARLKEEHLSSYPSALESDNFLPIDAKMPALKDIGFETAGIDFPVIDLSKDMMQHYADRRDIPSIKGTSRLSVHLRFGTVSIRKVMQKAKEHSHKFWMELVWREFYQQILWHFPYVVNHNFNRKYDAVRWRNNEAEFKRWCEGKTGYPIIDAGMRELNTTGYMHNRVRMIVAAFLTKHLLVDWRWGEAYFAEKLLDYDLASNNGGWQWAAGTGVDAAPYFRIFNPYLQTKKFDPELKYIRKWLPELDSLKYPAPMVDHEASRKRALSVYKEALEATKA